ncbi:hypothetical protein WR25_24502 [Diploscapter pachys]|uniref:Probable oligoribonuclease n=1 Tax=Diploscapter pachys TaxID=2018661 RepID=A0A2A2L7J8_9BILA|nr:hypothetical protein WR25_24502 [Diploscapter pachys]
MAIVHLPPLLCLICDPCLNTPEFWRRRKSRRCWKRAGSGDAVDKSQNMVWVDLEMTGLNVDKHTIVEIATIVTDGQLNIIAEGPNLVIHQSEEVLDKMDDWCKNTFAKNGLTERIRNSKISLAEAEQQTLDFLAKYTNKGVSPLAGNSVHADRRFIIKYMPKIDKHLHYRIIDVSTIKELCRRWYPKELSEAPPKKLAHLALDDIRESIDELKYYRRTVFK